jgi:hypothetical protein
MTGAATSSARSSYLLINFQENGRLTNIWNPTQDANLRLTVIASRP